MNKLKSGFERLDTDSWTEVFRLIKVGQWSYDLGTGHLLWCSTIREIHEVEDGYIPTIEEAFNFYSTVEPGREAITKAVASGIEWNLECNFVSAKGKKLWVRAVGKPTYDADRKIIGYAGILQDVTDHKLALEATQQYKAELEYQKYALDEHAIVSIADITGNIIYINEKFSDISGYRSDEIIGENHRKINSGIHGPKFWRNFWETITNGHSFHGEICNRRKNGELYWVDSTVVPYKNSSGNIVRYISIRTDITQRKEAEKQRLLLEKNIQQMQKMEALGQLVGGIAHDFNNILAVTNGYASLLKIESQGCGNPKLYEYSEHIEKAGNRAKNMVQNMLSFSRGDLSKNIIVDINKEIENFSEIITSVLPSYINVNLKVSPQLLYAEINPASLHQVLMNLCLNSKKSIIHYGNILIEAKLVRKSLASCHSCGQEINGDFIEISVIDNGLGIPAEVKKRVFEPFYTTQDISKGSGMGLAIVHGIIHSAHGHVTISSTKGAGARVNVLLPTAEKTNLQCTAILLSETAVKTVPHNILIVDDEASIGLMLKRYLELENFSADNFDSACSALEAIKENSYSLVITDITMPNMSGIELCKTIKKSHPNLPVIAMTGYSDDVSEKNCKELGFDNLITKPVNFKMLKEKMTSIMGVNSDLTTS